MTSHSNVGTVGHIDHGSPLTKDTIAELIKTFKRLPNWEGKCNILPSKFIPDDTVIVSQNIYEVLKNGK